MPTHGLGHGHCWGNELPAPPQDHPQRLEVPKVSQMISGHGEFFMDIHEG